MGISDNMIDLVFAEDEFAVRSGDGSMALRITLRVVAL